MSNGRKVNGIVIHRDPPLFLNQKRSGWGEVFTAMEVGDWFKVAKLDYDKVTKAAINHLGTGNYSCRRAKSNSTVATYILQRTG